MKMIKAIVSFLGPLGTAVAVLAASVGVTLILRSTVRSVSEFFTPKVTERVGGDAVIQRVETKFQYKPLIVFDSDILIIPCKELRDWPLPNYPKMKLPDEKFAKMETEYRGFAEYVVDLNISPETLETNAAGKVVSIKLYRPRCPFENVKLMDAQSTNRWRMIKGSDKRWTKLYKDHEAQIITANIHANANTPENRQIAEEQTRRMVNTMIGDFAVDPVQGVEIKWLDNP